MSDTPADIEAQAFRAALPSLEKFEPDRAAQAAIATAEAAMSKVLANAEIAGAVAGAACRAGCSHCCRQVVGITAAEEVMVVEAIKRLPKDIRDGVRRRHHAASCQLGKMPVDQWQASRIACPLLDEAGLCVIHSDRPLPCRAVLSADEAACRSWAEGADGARIPLVAAQRRVYASAQAGLAQALAATGIPPGPVSLIEALDLAFG